MGIYEKFFLKGLEPDPLLTISEWADSFRFLPKESSAEPGKWRTNRFPFSKEIMDVLSPQDPTTEVKVIKGTQIGGTEIANNFLMTYMDLYPSPMLLMLPTESLLKKHRQMKLVPSVRAIKKLAKKIKPGKTKNDLGDNSMMEFPGGSLVYAYSNSTANFRSLSCRIVCLDDVDGYPDDVNNEGSPIALAKNRADSFPNRKIYINSTPTLKGISNIEKEFEDSDQREYFMPCPFCKELITFDRENFVYDFDEENYELKGDVVYSCPKCGSLIEEHHKTWMMSEENGAKWIPQNPGHPYKGYRIPSYYSPLGFLSWNKIFREYLKAKKALKVGNEKLMKTWVNTRDARPWEEQFIKVKVDIQELLDRKEEYTAEVPRGVRILTAGIDTQDDRFEIEVVGWGEGYESWSIDYKIIHGDPDLLETQKALDLYLQKTFKHESGNLMRIYAAGFDTGGHKTNTMYSFCKKRYLRKFFALKGSKDINAPITTGRFSLKNKGKVPLFSIGVNTAKDDIYSALTITSPGALYMHFPNKDIYDENYFKQLTAEKKVNGRWLNQSKKRNEAIDVRVYARAALAIVGIDPTDLANQDRYFFYQQINQSQNTQKKQRTFSKGIR